MNIIESIQEGIAEGVKILYQHEVPSDKVNWNMTRKEFDGDYTIVVFPYTRAAKKSPEAIGQELGAFMQERLPEVADFNVIKGFLNLSLSDDYWTNFLQEVAELENYGQQPPTGKKVLVEFASPNTNKPLHFGHVRNILLGWSSAKILETAGHEVVKMQIINDRGIAICKSMLAWQRLGNEETPESSGTKGDHLVGKYYVAFDKLFREEYAQWQREEAGQAVYAKQQKEGQSAEQFFKAYKNTYFNQYSEVGKAAKEMLLKWEAGEEEVINLWKMMNGWVYKGYDETFENLGVHFDDIYYESDTYLLGKDSIEEGLKAGVFYKKEDGSVWIDLEAAKLDHKLVLRSDGTSVYMTQDIGTAQKRYDDYQFDKMVYVVGDEQNYHFQVLFEIMKALKAPFAEELYHLSYGMIELTTGKMKSREGTIVDADDLMKEVIGEAKASANERGTISDLAEEDQEQLFRKVGMAALKYYVLKVNPQRRMIFEPKESVDLQGNTGPYIQNAYVRVQSVFRKLGDTPHGDGKDYTTLLEQEKDLIQLLSVYPDKIIEAAEGLDPSAVAKYAYDLAKAYHRFYHDCRILTAETEAARDFRLKLSKVVGKTLFDAMNLLGIEMPDRM
ncbi:MAG: arginine--tRNA ligase [Bacteroidota bacterium]